MQAAMQVERGWSSSYDRKMWRWMARRAWARPFALSGPASASITFDDIPDNAASKGAPILERADARGTFFVAPETCGMQDRYWRVVCREAVRDLAVAGHEIGCHTARHVNVQSLGRLALRQECERSDTLLTELTGAPPRNFAYPFGDIGVRQMRPLAARFRSCRTIYEGLNTGTIDLGKVKAIGLFDSRITRVEIEALIRQTVSERGWLVFYTHDVAEAPTFMGTSPRLLADTLAMMAAHGLPCLTVDQALTRHGLSASL
jgi:peptidoglycan/xylan/chitin deacetylase (PgdA/CDA1 family)